MRSRAQFWRIAAGLILFSCAFGYVEAAVVAYLRAIYAPMRAHFYPNAPAQELFPLLSLQQLQRMGPENILRLKTELGREVATLLMLAGAALTAARKPREFVAAFVICFGIWDVTFYLFLRLLLNWPASFFTWDILFLLPVPWVGPVIAPVLVAISMIAGGFLVLWREYAGAPIRIGALRWSLIVVGGALVFTAFVWDFRNTASGGAPNPFNWILFLSGEVIGLAAFASSLTAQRSRPRT